MPLSLTLTHLYPKHLNLYGDTGNVFVLKRRCEWLGIDLTVTSLTIGDKAIAQHTDFYFMGGGQDTDQIAVVEDFHTLKAEAIKTDTEAGVVFLGVCGGYQLMGNTFLMGNGQETKGLGIINVTTKAPGTEVKERCIGNLAVRIAPSIVEEMTSIYSEPKQIPETLVGFENHSGQTYLGSNVDPLGFPTSGFGNNYSAKDEGARYKNVFGSYMHGSLLPKNPHFADYLIWLALARKYSDRTIRLTALPDAEEFAAHHYILECYA
ncbi:MAG: glutamine amidotransferase [Cyanobacteria bacterium J06627_8]